MTVLTVNYDLSKYMSQALAYGYDDTFIDQDTDEYNKIVETLKERHGCFNLTEVSENSWFGYPELGNRNMSGDISTFTFIVERL